MGRLSKQSNLEKFYRHQSIPKEKHTCSTIFVLLIGIILGYFIYISKPLLFFKKVHSDLPYVFDVAFHKELVKFSDEEDHNQILVVYGPKGIGKTSGLKAYAKELQEAGRLPINIDLLEISQYSSEKEYVSYIAKAIVDGFNGINESAVKKSLLKPVVSKESTPSFYIKDKGGQRHRVLINDRIIKKSLNLLVNSVQVPSKAKGKNANINLLDALEMVSEGLRPILFVHEPQKWLKEGGCKDYCTDKVPMLNSILFGSGEGSNIKYSTGIVLDISDQSKLKLFKDSQHRFIRPYEFDPDVAIDLFVTKSDFFTGCQFKTIFNVFGGIGYYFAEAKRLLEGGYPFNDVQRILLNSLKQQIINVVQASDDPEKSKEVLIKMVAKHPELPNPSTPFAQQLINAKILSYATDEFDRLELATGGLENAISELKKSHFKM